MSVEVTRLPSGLTVVTDAMPHLESASLGVWVGAGSRDERPDEHGISHLLEHMAFKGTTRRTARQIAEEVEAVGGDLNAATSVETTSYYARVLRADVPLAIDVLVRHPVRSGLRSGGIAARAERHRAGDRRGRGRARRPRLRQAAGDCVSRASRSGARSSAPATPCARSTAGSSPPISRATIARPTWWWSAAGAVDHAALLDQVEQQVREFSGPPAPVPEPARFVGGSYIEARDLEQVHVALALHGLPQRDPDLFSMQVFTSVLGGGMSSRLFQEVREIRGLCYSIYAFHAPYSDTGMFGLYAGTDAADVAELMRVVVGEITNAAETITEAEVARAKAQMKAGLLMALESSGARIEQLARQMFAWGRPIALPELVAKIEAVTVESARAAGRALIARGRPAIAALGPGPGLESAATIAESLARRAA